MRRLKKSVFMGLFATTTLVLAGVKACNPDVMMRDNERNSLEGQEDSTALAMREDVPELVEDPQPVVAEPVAEEPQPVVQEPAAEEKKMEEAPKRRYNPIRSVHSYRDCFPDVQDVQIVAARKWGVKPVANRDAAETRKSELVYVGSNPYYDMDKRMTSSIPYLVPRASELLQIIGRNYLDSLAAKGVPLHKIIVTSVLRTEEDVAKLLKKNGNASDQSCHRFGTTIDICYNRYVTVEPPGESRRAVRDDTLKWVLSEVLRDIREQGRCYIKYEVKQGCFHITTR